MKGKILIVCLLMLSGFSMNVKAEEPVVPENAAVIKLPLPSPKGTISVEEAIQKRRSVRNFSAEPLTLKEISQVLWAAGGSTVDGVTGPTRAYPSAGAVYPLEIYVVIGNVQGMQPGIYKYDWKTHSLNSVKNGDFGSRLAGACFGQTMIENAPAVIIVTAMYDKIRERYGSRGTEKYVSMDAGHLGQNVHLMTQAMGLGTVMVGAFTDQEVAGIIGLSGDETPVYVMPVGRPSAG